MAWLMYCPGATIPNGQQQTRRIYATEREARQQAAKLAPYRIYGPCRVREATPEEARKYAPTPLAAMAVARRKQPWECRPWRKHIRSPLYGHGWERYCRSTGWGVIHLAVHRKWHRPGFAVEMVSTPYDKEHPRWASMFDYRRRRITKVGTFPTLAEAKAAGETTLAKRVGSYRRVR